MLKKDIEVGKIYAVSLGPLARYYVRIDDSYLANRKKPGWKGTVVGKASTYPSHPRLNPDIVGKKVRFSSSDIYRKATDFRWIALEALAKHKAAVSKFRQKVGEAFAQLEAQTSLPEDVTAKWNDFLKALEREVSK
jgi:hypothetical protein